MEARALPPLTVWNDHDHVGPIAGSTVVMMVLWLVTGITQIYLFLERCRSEEPHLQHSPLKLHIVVQAVSMGFGIVQSVLVLVACSFGLGQSAQVVLPRALATAQNLYFASNIILIFTLALVKISAALWVAGILVPSSVRHIKGVSKGVFCALLAASALWTVASFFALLLPCVFNDRCMGTVKSWYGIIIADMATDVAMALFAGHVVWHTRAKVQTRWRYSLQFCLRPLVAVCCGSRLLAISGTELSNDPTIHLWLFIVLTQLQMMVALIAFAFSTFLKGMNTFNTNFGAPHYSSDHIKMHFKRKATDRVITQVISNNQNNRKGDGESEQGIMQSEEGITQTKEVEQTSIHDEYVNCESRADGQETSSLWR